MRRIRSRAWIWYLSGGLTMVLAHFGLPGIWGSATYDLIGCTGAAAVIAGTWIHKPRAKNGWLLMAGAVVVLTIGDTIANFMYDYLGAAQSHAPGLVDALYLPGYPLILMGLWLLIRSRRAGINFRLALLDAGVVTASTGTAVWVLAVAPYQHSLLHSIEADFTFVYPLLDVVGIGMLALLLFAPGRRTRSFMLIAAAGSAVMTGDIASAAITASFPSLSATPYSALWLLGYVLLGAAALHPSMVDAFTTRLQSDADRRLTRGRVAILGAFAMCPPLGYGMLSTLTGMSVNADAVLWGSVVIFGLVLARMSALVNEVASSNTKLTRLQDERGQLLAQLVHAGDEERAGLAATLHDGPIQGLTATGLKLSRVKLLASRGRVEDSERVFAEVQDGIEREIASLRQTMSELRPPALDQRGLVEAIRDHVHGLQSIAGLTWKIHADVRSRPQPLVETALYRVAQEALTNVVKHAHASQVHVLLAEQDGAYVLEITDDGSGFRTDRLKEGHEAWRHFGLATMRERITAVDGRFTISSLQGGGTSVCVRVPAEAAA